MTKISKFLPLVISVSILLSCSKNTSKTEPSKVEHSTLLVATEGSIFNFNLDKNTISWEYKSPIDTAGNRNLFVLDGQNIFMPFESGKFINFDINTGKAIWQQQLYGNEDQPLSMSNDVNEQNKMLQSMMPLLMSKPLADGQNILIASTGQPMQTGGAWLYSFNKADGVKKWNSELPTVYNYFAPVRYHHYYFSNSAVFLEKYDAERGTGTSYGMFDGDVEIAGQPLQHHEVNQFERPIYTQMQSDGKDLFIGDEQGKIYALHLDENANFPNSDISDPNNTFIKNPKVFKWTFSDEKFNFQRNNITFLEDGTLYTEMKTGTASESCIFAINTDDGKLKWKKILKADILHWALSNEKIIGNTEKTIFYMDADGKNFTEINSKSQPLSNIEMMDETHFIYATRQGIEVFDINTKTAKLVFSKPFRNNEHNNLQIKYISK